MTRFEWAYPSGSEDVKEQWISGKCSEGSKGSNYSTIEEHCSQSTMIL